MALTVLFKTDPQGDVEVRNTLQQIRKYLENDMLPFPDDQWLVKGSADSTKRFRLELDTNMSANTDVVGTIPGNTSFTFAGLELANVFTANQEIRKSNPYLIIDQSNALGTGFGVLFQANNVDVGSVGLVDATGTYMQYDMPSASGLHVFTLNGTVRGSLSKDQFYITPSATMQNALRINHSDGTARWQMGVHPSSGVTYATLYAGSVTPGATNYLFSTRYDATDPKVYYNSFNTAGHHAFRVGDNAAGYWTLYTGNTAYGALYLGPDTPAANNYLVAHRDAATNPSTYWNVPSGGSHVWTFDGNSGGANVDKLYLNTTTLNPNADVGVTLGDSTHRWGLFSGTTAILKSTAASDNDQLAILDSSGNKLVQAGVWESGATYGVITLGNVTPSSTTHSILGNGTDLVLNAAAGGAIQLRFAEVQGIRAAELSSGSEYKGFWCGTKLSYDSSDYNILGDGSGNLFFNRSSGTTMYFRQANTTNWAIDTSGFFVAGADATYDIGTSSLRPRDGYFSRNLFLGATSVGTNGTQTMVVLNGTAPAGNVTNAFQMYSAGGLPKFRDASGNIYTLTKSSAYTVANPTTDRALDVTGDTLAQGLAVLGTLIADLQATGLIG